MAALMRFPKASKAKPMSHVSQILSVSQHLLLGLLLSNSATRTTQRKNEAQAEKRSVAMNQPTVSPTEGHWTETKLVGEMFHSIGIGGSVALELEEL